MVSFLRCTFAGFVLTLLGGFALAFQAPNEPLKTPSKPLKSEKTWKGSVEAAELLKTTPAPAYIADAKELEALYKAWDLGDKVPEIDFKTELVLVATTRGSGLGLTAMLDDKGDLTTQGIGTADFRSGFRYVFISIKKDGIKSIKGKPLKE